MENVKTYKHFEFTMIPNRHKLASIIEDNFGFNENEHPSRYIVGQRLKELRLSRTHWVNESDFEYVKEIDAEIAEWEEIDAYFIKHGAEVGERIYFVQEVRID